MLNEAPNNNDFMHMVNIVLNDVPNSNNATYIMNSVCLTIMGA